MPRQRCGTQTPREHGSNAIIILTLLLDGALQSILWDERSKRADNLIRNSLVAMNKVF